MNNKDKKFFTWLYILYVIFFCIIVYLGESRTRKFQKEGFTLCPYKGMEIWKKECPKEMNFIEKLRRELRW